MLLASALVGIAAGNHARLTSTWASNPGVVATPRPSWTMSTMFGNFRILPTYSHLSFYCSECKSDNTCFQARSINLWLVTHFPAAFTSVAKASE